MPPLIPDDEDIDFEALGAGTAAPEDDDDIDFEALGKGTDAASKLATHRWSIAKQRLGRLNTAASKGMVPTPQGDVPMPTDPLVDAAYGLTQRMNYGTGKSLQLPTMKPVPNTIAGAKTPKIPQIAANAAIGAINLPANTVNFGLNVIQHPVQTVKDTGHIIAAFAKAGAWVGLAAYMGRRPALKALEKKGLTPDDFNEMFVQDPTGTALMAYGGILGGIKGFKRAKAAYDAPRIARETRSAAAAAEAASVAQRMAREQGNEAAIQQSRAAVETRAREQAELLQAEKDLSRNPETSTANWTQEKGFAEGSPESIATDAVQLTPEQMEAARQQAWMESSGASPAWKRAGMREGEAPDAHTNAVLEEVQRRQVEAEARARVESGQEGPFQERPNEPILDSENQQYPRPGGPRLHTDKPFRGRVGEEPRSFMEPQPERAGSVGEILEPSRAIEDIAKELSRAKDVDPRIRAWYERNGKRLQEGTELTPDEVSSKSKLLRDKVKRPIAALEKTTLYDDKGRPIGNGKGKGKRSPTASFLGTQELYEAAVDLATHFARKSVPFAKWATEMVKATGIKSKEVLKHLWEQAKLVVKYIDKKVLGDKGPPLNETPNELYARLAKNPPEGEFSPRDYDNIPGARRIEQNIEARARAVNDPALQARMAFEQQSHAIDGLVNNGRITREEGAALQRELGRQHMEELKGEPAPPEEGMISEERRQAVMDYEGAPKRFTDAPVPPRKGPTLSSLGGQEIYERLVDAATKIGTHIAKDYPKYADWAKQVRDHAGKHGIALTDQQLRDAWGKVAPTPSVRETINSAIDAMENGTQDGVGKRFAGVAFDGLHKMGDTIAGPGRGWDWANTVANNVKDIWDSDFGTAPSFVRAKRHAPAFYEAVTHDVTSQGTAYIQARGRYLPINEILGDSKPLRNTFSDLLLDDRARMHEARGEATDIPKMDPQKRAEALANPKIQEAIKYYKEQLLPEIESLTVEAGNTDARVAGPLGLYHHVRRIGAFEKIAHELRDRELTYGTGSGSNSPYNVRPRTPRSSKRAKGMARGQHTAPENSLFHMIYNTYADRVTSITREKLRQSIRDAAITKQSDLDGKQAPLYHELDSGRHEKVVGLPLEDRTGKIEDVYYVPDFISDGFRKATDRKSTEQVFKYIDKASNLATTQVVLMPAEAIRHGANVVQVGTTLAAQKIPGIWAVPEAALSAMTLGTSRIASSFHQAFNLHGAEFAALLRDMAEGGALRMRGYEGFAADPGFLMRMSHKFPPSAWLKDAVFGDPGMKKGLGGIETRLRAVLWNLAKKDNPKLTNAQLGRLVNDAMGSYVDKLTPGMVRAMQPIDPFIRAGTAMLKTGMRTATGKNPLGHRNATNVLATYGTLVAAMYYSKLLDDKGEWPFQKPGWSPSKLMYFDRGGRRVGFSMADIANPLSRAASYTGASALAQSFMSGNRSADSLFMDWKRGVTNSWLNRLGPLARTITRGGLNKEPYLLPDNNFMPASSPSMAGSKKGPLGEWSKSTFGGSVPLVAKLAHIASAALDHPEDGKQLMPDDYMARLIFKTNEIFSVPYFPKLYPQTDIQRPVQQYATQNQYDDTVNDISRRLKNISPDEQDAFIMKEIEERLTDDLINSRGRPMPANIAAIQELYTRLGRGPANAIKGMALQDINQEGQ